MIRVGTIYQKEISDAYIQSTVCPHCESVINVNLSRSVQTGTILFIPFIKKTVQYYSTCPCCNMKYIFSKQDYNQIQQSPLIGNEWNKICNSILKKEKEKSDNSIVRSKKHVLLASVLSLFFGLFGIQNLYMGHKKRFLINISLFALSIIMFAVAIFLKIKTLSFSTALLLATNIYWGIVDLIRILSGHAKDSNGAYLLTDFQYKKRLLINSNLHKKSYIR